MQKINVIKPFAVGRLAYMLNAITPFEKGVFVYPVVDKEIELYSIIEDLDTNKSTLALKNIDGIYTPLNINVDLDNLKVRRRLDCKTINDKLISRFPKITNHKNFLHLFRGKNIIFNSYDYNASIKDRFHIRNEKRLYAFVNNIFDIVESTGDEYDERYILVALDYTEVKAIIGQYNRGMFKEKDVTTAEYVLYYLKFNTNEFVRNMKRAKAHLVFYSSNGVFKVSHEDLSDVIGAIAESVNVTEKNLAELTLKGVRKIKTSNTEAEPDIIENEPEDIDKEEEVIVATGTGNDIEMGTDEDGNLDVLPVQKLKLKKTKASQYKDKGKAKLIKQFIKDSGDVTELNAAEILGDIIINEPADNKKILQEAKKLKAIQLSRTRKPSLREARLLAKTVDITAQQAIASINDEKVEPVVFHDVHTLDDLNVNSYVNMNDTYTKTVGKTDMLNTLAFPSENDDFPLYVDKYVTEDVADKFNNTENLKATFKDPEGNRTSINVDIPKLEGNIMYINGNKYEIQSQRIYKPIVKFKDDVMLVMNYNKAFVMLSGKYLNHNQSRLVRFVNKLMKNPELKSELKYTELGVTEEVSMDERSLMFADMSKYIRKIYKDKDNFIYFKTDDLKDTFPEYDTGYKNGRMCIGKYNGQAVTVGVSDDIVFYTNTDGAWVDDKMFDEFLIEFIENIEPEKISSILSSINTKVNKGYSVVKILSKKLPVALVLAYTEGLDVVLKRADIEYRLEYGDKKPKIDKTKYSYLQFEDCYLVYRDDSPQVSILLSSLQSFDFTEVTFTDMCDVTTGVAALMLSEFSNGNLPLYVSAFKTSFVDHISKDVLLHYDLPTDFCGVLIYASNLLASDIRMAEDDARLYRIRNAEVIQVALYKVMANAYSKYVIAKKRGTKNPKLEVARNAVIREIQQFPNINTYSTVNPIVSADSMNKVTLKGPSGLNMDRAFSVKKRESNNTDLGVAAMPSVYTGSVGIVRRTPIDPKITSSRGYIEGVNESEIDDLSARHLLSPTELITPGCSRGDDGPRVFMNAMQKGHLIGTLNPSPMNLSNGYDEMIGYFAKEFASYAAKDGIVKKITDDYVIVEYKDGTEEAFKIRNVERHSAKAKLIDNDMQLAKGLKVGTKLKAKDPIMFNKRMFVEIPGTKLPVFCIGQMKFVAFMSAPEVYEDACILSESLADSLASYDYKNKAVVLSAKTIIKDAISAVDIKVKAGDSLIKYINTTGDDGLDDIAAVDTDDILTQERNASHAGTVTEIRVNYCCNKSDMSNSMKNYVDKITKLYTEKGDADILGKENMDKFKTEYMSRIPRQVKEGTKVAGKKIAKGDVIVEYIAKSYSRMGHADKVTIMSALKGETSRIFPDNKMPVGIETGLQADMMMSPTSPYKRKVFSFIINGAVERLIYDLCEECKKIK